MVTVDPTRDTAVLADYVQSFVPGAHALATDDQAALQAVAGPFGVSYEVTTQPDRRDPGRPLQLPVRRRRHRQAGAHVAGAAATPRPTTSAEATCAADMRAAARATPYAAGLTAMIRPLATLVAVAVGVARPCWLPGRRRVRRPGRADRLRARQITSITPAVPGDRRAEIVGGDSFLRLVVAAGHRRRRRAATPRSRTCTSDPTASSRRTSARRPPTSTLAATAATAPAGADPTLPPDWQTVGTGGTYAWHDHRAHWMSPNPPPAASPAATRSRPARCRSSSTARR